MKNLKYAYFIIAVLVTNFCFAQLSDLARVDYTIIPRNNSTIEYNRTRVLFNYPIKLKKEGSYLFLGLDYSNINLQATGGIAAVDDDIDGYQLLDLNIGYTQPLKNDWRLGVRLTPGLSSNLKADDLTLEDIVLSTDIVFIKDKTKDTSVKTPWRLIAGVSYSGNRGFPFPLPFISYYRRFSPNWSYNIGVPKSNLQYRFSDKHRLKLFAQLDGFTSNLQRGVPLLNGEEDAQSINMSLIVSGLQYEFHIIDHLEFYARAAYILSSNTELRNENRDTIFELDSSNTLYIRTGVRFKI
ncbi:DUF6268 family outer membrane beta-barrel protein [Kordia sp.]|uniref:DUF6268 family outer membrane beta-barrel protein n=1 Tax=Kordia sp. TaxID=1965332 RepID=UPI003D2A9369